jgi:V8-like Glu-specific endopeptidase
LDPTALPVKSYRTYYVFDPITGNKISSKTYTLGTLYDTTNSSPETILGIDNRIAETSSGLSGVINVQTALGESGGTAFVIDSHTMLTAAHLLKQGTKARGGLQFKAFNGSSTPSSLSITPVEYHIPSIYMTSTSTVEKCKYDYAIVTVAENLEDYINFDLGVPRINIESNIVHTLYVTGYGGEGEGVNSSLIDIKSTGSGLLMSPPSNYDEFEICYSTDTAPGNSGSPAYIINSDNSKTVIGIHVRGENTVSKGDLLPHLGRNSATRITPDILAFVYNNDHLITDDMID